MTNKALIDVSAYNLAEGCLVAAHIVYQRTGRHACKMRVSYQSMMNVITGSRWRNENFIVEESRMYLCTWTPGGRLLVYFDQKCLPGTNGVISLDDGTEFEVILAY